jgi:hypothetical protein
VVFALLGLMAVAAASGVARAAASLDHACCDRSAGRDAAPEPLPCDGFLPLSCCQAAALPGSETPLAAPAAVLPAHAPVEPVLAACAGVPPTAAAVPRASPLRLSVVLQV